MTLVVAISYDYEADLWSWQLIAAGEVLRHGKASTMFDAAKHGNGARAFEDRIRRVEQTWTRKP